MPRRREASPTDQRKLARSLYPPPYTSIQAHVYISGEARSKQQPKQPRHTKEQAIIQEERGYQPMRYYLSSSRTEDGRSRSQGQFSEARTDTSILMRCHAMSPS